MSLSLKIKCTSREFCVQADNDLTIYDLKVIVSIESGIQPEHQTLLFKGRVCDDDQSLEELAIANNCLLILLQSGSSSAHSAEEKQDTTTTTNNPPTANNDLMMQMMGSPMMNQMLSSPELLQNLFNSSPALKQLLKDNPQLRHVLKDPTLMKNAMRAASSPEYFNEMLKSNDRALRNIESIPGGFSALTRMYHQIQKPMERAMDDMYRQRFGKCKTVVSKIDTRLPLQQEPIQNPWVNQNNMQQPGQQFFLPNFQASNSNTYALQLNELRSMGFLDEQQNVTALVATGGNVSAAVQYLLNNRNNNNQK